ncbi:CoB--CoM heterodisulfide reductase iron-sulfur subunit B family protein [Pseudodesulfovibrio sp. zrk46]|uniref:CoB--CoM heterodisulfide reductase iron-sulfur subunit B family protein n=1 Tax=Pseudodesulfovibrio sp. zrk46 TaxID=2725288 RepID=UPI0014490EFE|nr:CoB--CoM heterodisulfide reductase iron-sulfur subunit B family protein [Pseudodesulfovibrio sp. zrk46]QJB57133.1 CoB--CoM heterodisulfide reductase [Pseudodesulfovibrio sp. zrk46]
MRFAYFPGCKIQHHLPEYGSSVEAVCNALDIELVKLEFNCCGWPVRHENELASIYSAVRNFAQAEAAGLSIMTPCKCCFGNLKYASHRLAEDPKLSESVAYLLAQDGLSMPKSMDAFHLLTILDEQVGAEFLRRRTAIPLSGVKVACHYGCHALRPGNVTGFDDPLAPTLFERIIQALGAETVDWDLRLECCGHPLRGRDDIISQALMRKKVEGAKEAGADIIVTACTYCQLQFDRERAKLPRTDLAYQAPPAVLVTQLIGKALGLDAYEVGLNKNHIPWHAPVL